jgi:hypothetical protein
MHFLAETRPHKKQTTLHIANWRNSNGGVYALVVSMGIHNYKPRAFFCDLICEVTLAKENLRDNSVFLL